MVKPYEGGYRHVDRGDIPRYAGRPGDRAMRKTTAAKKTTAPGRRRTRPPSPVVEQLPAPEPRYRENTGRLTPAQRHAVPTEDCLVQALCSCEGMLLVSFGRLDGDYPYVSVRITRGCVKGHPEHAAPGVIMRFPPHAIRRLPQPAVT